MQTRNDLGGKVLGIARGVGILDDHGHMSWCGIQMAERCGWQAKLAADGDRQVVSRGQVRTASGYAGINPG
jgi:hypothetical protein